MVRPEVFGRAQGRGLKAGRERRGRPAARVCSEALGSRAGDASVGRMSAPADELGGAAGDSGRTGAKRERHAHHSPYLRSRLLEAR